MCMALSPNCWAVTIFEYSSISTDVTLSPSCLSVPSEHIASQSKWKKADLDLLKLAKMRKSVWHLADKISDATIEREFKFRKRMAFSVLGSLITVPLQSTLAVNNLGLKFVS